MPDNMRWLARSLARGQLSIIWAYTKEGRLLDAAINVGCLPRAFARCVKTDIGEGRFDRLSYDRALAKVTQMCREADGE